MLNNITGKTLSTIARSSVTRPIASHKAKNIIKKSYNTSPSQFSPCKSHATKQNTDPTLAAEATNKYGEAHKGTFRYPLPWKDPDFYDEKKLEGEMRRVFDVCHGCRLCYSLCDSFPTLFDIIDNSKTGELDSVPSASFKQVVDKCTMCDLCFMSKCPYVPPHTLNVDFPHLMLRYRAVENMSENVRGVPLQKPEKYSVDEISGSRISQTVDKSSAHVEEGISRTLEMKPESVTHAMYTNVDFVGPLASRFSKLVNWMLKTNQEHPSIFRRALKYVAGVHPKAELPNYVPKSETFVNKVNSTPVPVNTEGKAYQKRKVLMYTTCLVNYNKPEIGHALRLVLLHNGVEVKAKYPGCCGMPQFEQGKIKETVQQAEKVTQVLSKYIDEGYDIVAPVASCALMLKKEWPLLLPDHEVSHKEPDSDRAKIINDAVQRVQKVAKNTYDASEYIVKLSKEHGLLPVNNHAGSVTLHHSCHSRAQAVGFKSQELLQLIPELKISSIERCSGHGGSFGVDKEGHEVAMKVGKPVFRNAVRNFKETENDLQEHIVASDCPLAVDHIKQGMTNIEPSLPRDKIKTKHPVQILADAYGLKY